MSSPERNSPRPSIHVIVAPELRGLKITAGLCEAYDRLTWEALSLHKVLSQQVPENVFYASLTMVESPKSHSVSALMSLLKEKSPVLHDYIVKLSGVAFIANLLEGEITPELLRRKRNQVFDGLAKVVPSDLLNDLRDRLDIYKHRPRKRPAVKTVLYLQALDFKIENPRKSWGKLAKQFCGSPAQENTLKAWAYRMKKELAKFGVRISLENPDYAVPQHPKTQNVKR